MSLFFCSIQAIQAHSSISTDADGMTYLVAKIPLGPKGSITNIRQFEQQMQIATNQIGLDAMAFALEAMDTEGEPIRCGKVDLTSKGRFTETYHTVFGDRLISRHVYQSSKGGAVFVPLEDRARIISLSSPHFASLVAGKYAETTQAAVVRDLAESHQNHLSPDVIARIGKAVAEIALKKETFWEYTPATAPTRVASIGLGMDGTCVPICYESKWKLAMVATLSLYDAEGEKLDTFCLGAAPQAGKTIFFQRVAREIDRYKKLYPDALWVGVTDGEADFRPFLSEHCTKLILDFYHAAEFVTAVAEIMCGAAKGDWLNKACHDLKNKPSAAANFLKQMQAKAEGELTKEDQKIMHASMTYFTNNLDRMDYAAALEAKLPIGSGITEATCRTLVKQRFCLSGMKWLEKTVDQVITLRALRLSEGRWEEFWRRIERYGY